ncbi:MAG: hypothetical protein ACLTYW_06430 [Collinsella sp.]
MHIFNSRADFDAQMKSVKKWMRTGQALDGVSELQHDVAYSIGDSLVYWWVNAHEAATADLVGHRRYHAVLAPLDGNLTVEVASKADLTCTRAYSDIDDRERFEGTGETVTIPAGGVAVVEIDEAYRVVADAADPRVVVLHVTVEGYSFPTSSIRPPGRLLRAVKGDGFVDSLFPIPLSRCAVRVCTCSSDGFR